jgi:hypothetical protein
MHSLDRRTDRSSPTSDTGIRSSKPAGRGDPPLGRFDSFAASWREVLQTGLIRAWRWADLRARRHREAGMNAAIRVCGDRKDDRAGRSVSQGRTLSPAAGRRQQASRAAVRRLLRQRWPHRRPLRPSSPSKPLTSDRRRTPPRFAIKTARRKRFLEVAEVAGSIAPLLPSCGTGPSVDGRSRSLSTPAAPPASSSPDRSRALEDGPLPRTGVSGIEVRRGRGSKGLGRKGF